MKFEVQILMFGRTNVGKTSLLASMFNALQTNAGFSDLTTISRESHELDETLERLKKFIRTLKAGRPVGIPSTPTRREYTFTFNLSNLDHSLEVKFVDMPGEWLDAPDKRQEWIQLLRTSDIIINVISAPAMMEHDREYNEDINKPSRFNEYLGEAFGGRHGTGTKKVFLVPTKCEKYADGPEEMHGVLKMVYANQRAQIRAKKHLCYLLPVNTLGAVVFDQFVLDEGTPIDKYKMKGDSTKWEPKNNDVLVAYILHHCIRRLRVSFPAATNSLSSVQSQIQPMLKAETVESPSVIKHETFSVQSSSGCFGADTRIPLSDGRKIPISMIEEGMVVLTRNQKGEIEPQPVTKLAHHGSVALVQVEVGERKIRATKNHPVLSNGRWKRICELKTNERVDFYDADRGAIESRAVAKIAMDEVVSTACNIQVERNGCYVAEGMVASSYVTLNRFRQMVRRTRAIFEDAQEEVVDV